jgi:hypothetical protein
MRTGDRTQLLFGPPRPFLVYYVVTVRCSSGYSQVVTVQATTPVAACPRPTRVRCLSSAAGYH